MSNAVKGALLSAVVFPGVGQIVLKRYGRGVAFMVTALAGFAVMVGEVGRQAASLLESVESGGAVDPNAIASTAAPSDSLVSIVVLVAVTICWMYGVVDAYRIGKEQDAAQAGSRLEGRS